MKLDIAFDLDSCLGDFTRGLEEILAIDGYKLLNNDNFEIVTDPPITKSKRYKMFETLYRHWTLTPPYEGVSSLLERLHSRSQQPILIVTSRPTSCAHYTHKYVSSFCNVPYIICFANPKFGKAAYLNDKKFFMEDRRKTIFELLKKGKIIFKPKCSWNKMPPHDNLFEIEGPKDLLKIVDSFISE
jgi:hypothetical protein